MFKYKLAQPEIPPGFHNAGRAGDQLCAYMNKSHEFGHPQRCPSCYGTIYKEMARMFCGSCGVAVHQSNRCRVAKYVYVDNGDWAYLCTSCAETD